MEQLNQTYFKESDVDVEWYSGSGAGGQNRNKTQNCCRATHRLTGLVRTSQSRDRTSSLRSAMGALRDAVTSAKLSDNDRRISNLVESQVGSGMRGDKRRTYRLQEGTVKDHLTGKQTTYGQILKGQFETLR